MQLRLGSRRGLQRALLVGEDAHEVRGGSDVEDLDISGVGRSGLGHETAPRGARAEQADDQGYPCRVDVVDPLEVEDYGLGFSFSASVGGVEASERSR